MDVGYLSDLVAVWAAAVGFKKCPAASCCRFKSEGGTSNHILIFSSRAVHIYNFTLINCHFPLHPSIAFITLTFFYLSL